MLWDIQALMRPALSVIDLIPNIHRTPALTVLRRAVLQDRLIPLSPQEKELAFLDAPVQLTSPIGGRVLKALYMGGHLKLKKPATAALPALDKYIATEATFRADVARIIAADEAQQARLAQIIADPDSARPDEITPALIDKVITARLGRGTFGSVKIAGLTCHRSPSLAQQSENDRVRAEARVICWWLDASGTRQGDAD